MMAFDERMDHYYYYYPFLLKSPFYERLRRLEEVAL
jgi:hypothetical protein